MSGASGTDLTALKQTLIAAVARWLRPSDGVRIEAALQMAEEAHAGQTRKHGAPYLVHPLRVAIMLLDEFHQDDATLVAAGLLHDVLEDAPERISADAIQAGCGPDVLAIVQALTSPSEADVPDKAERNRRKAQQVAAAPKPAWYVKLADRIDNLRDATSLDGEAGARFRARYVRESVDYYLPLANQLADRRIVEALRAVLVNLGEKVMPQNRTPSVLEFAGVDLDVRRMELPANLDERCGPLLDAAVREMEAIERGELVNVDEGWQVGHYWLRKPELAPGNYRREIEEALDNMQQFADQVFRPPFRNILWVGIGGSALGPLLLYEVFHEPGDTAHQPDGRPQMFFFDNTDPAGFQRTLRAIDRAGGLAQTLTVIVSKSGGTPETTNGMEVARQEYTRVLGPGAFESHAVAITKAGSKLDKLAAGDVPGDPSTERQKWLARFPMWDWVGGRTSIFSAVGLLPACLLRLNVKELLAGAHAMDDATHSRNLAANPALLLAATWYHAVEVLGLRNMVVLPYSDRLALLSRYLQQLVMESLGKSGKGITVYGNKGSTDQHAYVQQLREGYRDFFVSFLRVLIPDKDWDITPGVTAGDYLAAFQEGTARALSEGGRPSLRMTVERVNERTLGALIALFERAVGYYGAMLGINTYHQPGVEAGKKAAGKILEVQSRLIEELGKAGGEAVRVGELAKIAKTDVELVYDILHRLEQTNRCGIQESTAAAANPADRIFRWQPPAQ